MLVKGNRKLGAGIYHFSIPAGKTCPGKTEACASVCYAQKGFYYFSSVKASLHKNLRRSKRPNFAEKMIAAIGRRNISTFRIHVSGDFYSADYIHKWVAICRACPDVKFYAYTRSWRVTELQPALIELGGLENVALWWSADRNTVAIDGAPPAVDRIKVAYMQMDDQDLPPTGTALVFRVKHNTIATRVNNIRVCPVETGHVFEEARKPTCTKCKFCFKSLISVSNSSATLATASADTI